VNIAARPQKVDQQVVRRLQADRTLRWRDLQLLARRIQLQKAFHRVRDGQLREYRTRLVHEDHVVLVFAPVDSGVYLHVDLLAH